MTAPANMTAYSGQHKNRSVAGWADNQGYLVRFVHEPTGHAVEFPALISDFSDSHSPAFGQVHGANMHDPVITTVAEDGNFLGKPFIDIHMMNLLEGATSGKGITCVVEGLDYAIKFDEGILNANEGVIALNRSGKEIYPQSLEISISAKAYIESERVGDITSPLHRNYPSYGG